MSTRTLMTLQQFFDLPEDDSGWTYELDRGELIKTPPSVAKHELMKNWIAELLMPFAEKATLGVVLVESGFTLEPESWRRPDVSFLCRDRVTKLDLDEPLAGAPDLAIEVVSPSDSQRRLTHKVQHFLETGTTEVWIVYPDSREVNVISTQSERWLGFEETIESPVLPGLSLPVRSFFED
jgi:Uma2 family endonuclease